MSRCQRCHVEILDPANECPLCQCVIEKGEEEKEWMYPNARVVVKKFRLLVNLLLFLSIVAESIMIAVNFWTSANVPWSLVVGLVLIYMNVALRLAIMGRSDYMLKMVSLLIMAVLMLLGIDYLTGYRGWALNYVFPAGILLMDAGILLLMMINHRNWQSYMIAQMYMIFVSLIPLVLLLLGIISFPYLPIIAIGVSVFIFLGTLIIGDQRARMELKRRFHL